ncbi:MAG: glycosyltransferase [Muribaculaceae bacterium]|nr:glycosyltransferase [Muribaculaceae bacterium]
MRILIVNKFWYPRGGDCVVAMATAGLLRRMGHDVAVFTMAHPQNIADPHILGKAPQVELADRWRYLRRMLGGMGVKPAFARVLDEFNPQVVHLHNVHSYLSPVVARLAREHGCRVLWTMHDYKLLCPAYTCLRNGQPCIECVGRQSSVVCHRCMKHSVTASVAGMIEAKKWKINRLTDWVDTFVCPSEFMAQMLRRASVPSERVAVVPNFLPAGRAVDSPVALGRANYCCYVGRLSPEKGVETLLKAAAALPFTLRVAGDGPLLGELRSRYGHCRNIELLGRLDATHVAELLRLAQFSVMPSECLENFPMGVIESLCAGTPVVATRMGGIPELVNDSCGLLVPPADPAALAEAMRQAWSRRWNHAAIARQASSRFHEQTHYRSLMGLYTT